MPAHGARRRRPVPRAVAAVLVLLALAAAAGWALLSSPLTALDRVEVTGVRRADPAALEAAAADQLGRPLLRVDAEAVEERARRLPLVREVEVVRRWPRALELRVVERVPVAAVDVADLPAAGAGAAPEGEGAGGDGDVALLDERGRVLARAATVPEDLPLVAGGAAAAGGDGLVAASRVARSLPPELRERVAQVGAEGPDDVRLQLDDGALVRWGGPGSADLKSRVLLVLLQTEAEEYDVSAPTAPATRGAAQQDPADDEPEQDG